MAQIAKYRRKANRYITEEDDEADMASFLPASSNTPAMCAVFKILDPDEVEGARIDAAKKQREQILGKLRALNLNVDQAESSDKKHIYVTISAPDTMLKYEAQMTKTKLRLREEYGGALCPYLKDVDEKRGYDKPRDGFELFSSTIQLKLVDEVVRSEGYNDEEHEPIDFEELMAAEEVEDYFPLHHNRMRQTLIMQWANLLAKPQPLEYIREYFGEQIALFYTWYGFYITMLWIPALTGLMLFVTQVVTYFAMSGSLENPFVLVYCIVMCVWGALFCQLWVVLENTRKYEWDTLDYENEEKIREEFKESDEVLCDEQINEVTGEAEEFYYPDGTLLPIPTGRMRKQCITYLVIALLNIATIMLTLVIWVDVAFPLLTKDNVWVGGILAGFLNALMTILIDGIMDGVPELGFTGLMQRLVEGELWKTDTEHQDNIILKTFYFKIISKYFALAVVAFAVNSFPILGKDVPCPEGQCMPVLQVMVLTIVVSEIIFVRIQIKLLPVIKKYLERPGDTSYLKEKEGIKVMKTPMEEQHSWIDPSPVVEMYKDKVYQFGYIVMFGAAFPLIPFICLVNNSFDLRSRASTLLTQNKRPEPLVAADIGTYQMILEVLTTMAILTNSVIVGYTSHGLYFYLPWLNEIERLWAIVILEHFLILIKAFICSVIQTEPAEAVLEYNTQQERKHQALQQWDIVLDDD